MSASTKPPTGPVCHDCSSALDLFVERNNFEYAFVEQEDEDMLEWFEKACAEFQAQCDDFENVIGQPPTEEAKKHMRDVVGCCNCDYRTTVGFDETTEVNKDIQIEVHYHSSRRVFDVGDSYKEGLHVRSCQYGTEKVVISDFTYSS